MQAIQRHPRTLLLVLALAVLALGHRAPMVRQDNSPETLFAADRTRLETYHELVRSFGSDEVLMVQLRGARLDRPRDVRAVAALARQLQRLPGVQSVASVADALPADGEAQTDPDAEDLVTLQREVQAVAIYRKLGLVQPSQPALGVVASVIMRGAHARASLNRQLRQIVAGYQRYRPLVAGLTPGNAAIDRETRRSLMLFLPLTVVLMLAIGLALFRSPGALLALIAPTGGAVLMGLGALELSGEPITIVTATMPPLVFAIGFAGAVHLVSHHGALVADGLGPRQAFERTLADKLVPTTFAFVTTAVGFGSLALSDVRAIQVLGLLAAGSLLAALVLVSLGTPALLLVLRPRIHAPLNRRQALRGLARWSLRHRAGTVAVALGVLLPMMLGLAQLRSSIDGMEVLGDQVPEKRAFRALEAQGLGLNAVDIWIPGPAPDHAALLAGARRLAQMAHQLERQPGVTATLGVHDLLEVFQYRSTGRAGLPASLLALELLEPHQRARLQRRLRTMWHPRRGFKLTLLTTIVEPVRLAALQRSIDDAARRSIGGPVIISGHFMMLISTASSLMSTLVRSLALSVLVISVLFLVAFRSLRLALSGIAASLLPVAVVLGGMGWLGLELDIATVMTGSVAFGVAVDDTFHYLYHRREGGGILRAATIAGQGILATSLMIAGGFAVLALSGFIPLVRFGLLTALAVLVALVVDALLLPALVGCDDDNACRQETGGGQPAAHHEESTWKITENPTGTH